MAGVFLGVNRPGAHPQYAILVPREVFLPLTKGQCAQLRDEVSQQKRIQHVVSRVRSVIEQPVVIQ